MTGQLVPTVAVDSLGVYAVDGTPLVLDRRGRVKTPGRPPYVRLVGPLGGHLRADSHRLRLEGLRLLDAAAILRIAEDRFAGHPVLDSTQPSLFDSAEVIGRAVCVDTLDVSTVVERLERA